MKLEPVAWTHESYLPPTAHSFAGVKNRHPSFPVALYAIPEGYVVVPVEPTEDMLVSGQEAWVICKTNRSAVEDCEHSAAVWKAMIAAKERQ